LAGLTHFDEQGRALMVDVSAKAETERTAIARGRVVMEPATLARIQEGQIGKGDVLGVARLAGIMAAKRTSDLIPLCHPLPLTDLQVSITPERAGGLLRIRAEAATTGQTGVEMEAMTAASVAALTVYDMVKGVERGVTIGAVRLIAKSGGKSGDWVRHDPPGHEGSAGPSHQPGARAAGRIAKSPRGGRSGSRRPG
jgi:cyclic pyranopterin monophosphate synthase